MRNHSGVNTFFGALVFLVGSGIGITRCIARQQEIAAAEICSKRFNLDENEAGLIMFVTVGADEHEVVAREEHKCLVDCMAREAGYLNADGEFTVAEFIEKELKLVEHAERKNETSADDEEGRQQEEMEKDHKGMLECVKTVENWDGWDRREKCHKGYLFFKCKSYGVQGFKLYMEIQRHSATGLNRSPSRFDYDLDETSSSSESAQLEEAVGTSGEPNWNGTSSTTDEEPSVTESLSERVSNIRLNQVVPSISHLNTP